MRLGSFKMLKCLTWIISVIYQDSSFKTQVCGHFINLTQKLDNCWLQNLKGKLKKLRYRQTKPWAARAFNKYLEWRWKTLKVNKDWQLLIMLNLNYMPQQKYLVTLATYQPIGVKLKKYIFMWNRFLFTAFLISAKPSSIWEGKDWPSS
jgi:hypothetical protein